MSALALMHQLMHDILDNVYLTSRRAYIVSKPDTLRDTARIAEAMGLRFKVLALTVMVQWNPNEPFVSFAPFTDAGDDHEVLRWMRGVRDERWERFCQALRGLMESRAEERFEGYAMYRAGDNSRALIPNLGDGL